MIYATNSTVASLGKSYLLQLSSYSTQMTTSEVEDHRLLAIYGAI